LLPKALAFCREFLDDMTWLLEFPWLLDQIQLVQGDLTRQKKKMPKLGTIRHGVIVGLKWVKGNDHISGFVRK